MPFQATQLSRLSKRLTPKPWATRLKTSFIQSLSLSLNLSLSPSRAYGACLVKAPGHHAHPINPDTLNRDKGVIDQQQAHAQSLQYRKIAVSPPFGEV